MTKIYSSNIIKIPSDTTNQELLTLKSMADIFYTAYETVSSEQMKPITKVIMESIRLLRKEECAMSFGKNVKTGEIALFLFDLKPDGVYRTVQKDKCGFYLEIEG